MLKNCSSWYNIMFYHMYDLMYWSFHCHVAKKKKQLKQLEKKKIISTGSWICQQIIPAFIENNFCDYGYNLNKCKLNFYAPGLKGLPGASSNQIVRLSVRLSVCLSICPSVRYSVPLTNKVQYLKFGWWYSNQNWTVSSSMGSSHFTDITCPWGWGRGQI